VVRGWELLARACQQLSAYTLAVDLDLAPDSDLSQYDLVYLCANGKFSLEAKHQAALARYLETGKMILIDAIDPAADTSFNSVFEKMEFKFMPLAAEDALLVEPFLFSSAPPGYQEAQVSRYRSIIYSCCGYGLAWAGQLAPGHAARADIRAAHEWGVNIIHYCLNHSGG
jgi:hypothetical protein